MDSTWDLDFFTCAFLTFYKSLCFYLELLSLRRVFLNLSLRFARDEEDPYIERFKILLLSAKIIPLLEVPLIGQFLLFLWIGDPDREPFYSPSNYYYGIFLILLYF